MSLCTKDRSQWRFFVYPQLEFTYSRYTINMFTNEIIQEIVWRHYIRGQNKYWLAKYFYTNVQKIQEIIDEYGSTTEKEWKDTPTYLLRSSKEKCTKV